MCIDDACSSAPTDRRSFLVGASAASAGLTMLGSEASSQGIKPETRVLDNPKFQHGKVVFKHGGVDTLDGYLARPKAEGRYAPVVPFHPGPVTADEIARLRAPVQVHCGTADRSVPVNAIRDLERMLRAQSTPVEVNLYEGADHGFLVYTRPTNKVDAAKLAWTRTTQFLHTHLG